MAADKVFSVRADEATIAQLEKLADESGMKKTELLPALLSAYATEQAKGALPGRASEIENVESLLAQIKTAYLASLELNANAEARIRTEYEARIASNEQAVESLKEKAERATMEAKEAKAALADCTKERDDANARANTAEAALEKLHGDTAEEKDRMLKFNASLQAQVDTLKEKAEATAAELAAAAELEKESAKTKAQLKDALARAEKAEAEAADLRGKLTDAQTKAKDDLTELRGRYDEKMDNLRGKMANEKDAAVIEERKKVTAEMQQQVEKYQTRYEELLLKIGKNGEGAEQATATPKAAKAAEAPKRHTRTKKTETASTKTNG